MARPGTTAPAESATRLEGRYRIFFSGQACGEERWRIESDAAGHVLTGEQEMAPPHPVPSRHEYRATLTPGWRLTGLEILWTVGERRLRAIHEAAGGAWRVRIEYGGQVREQQGDFPDYCEVEYATHLFNTIILARRDFRAGGEHEFPVLRIGPPFMAVTPDRMRYRCVEVGTFPTALGPVAAKRYELSLPERGEAEGYTFWADDEGLVLESYEGLDTSRPWMRLTEFRRGA